MRRFFRLKASCILTLLFVLLQSIIPMSFAYSPYSNEELDSIEKEFVTLINQSDLIDRDPLSVSYLNALGKKLARAGHIKPPTFFIVKSNQINAFAGPGGYIGVHTQLILATKNENELAGVLAHEIAHVRLHHLYQLIEHEKTMRAPLIASLLASAALGLINPAVGNGALMASLTGFSQDNINFVRANEKEADSIGIDMLKKAGFDPKGMVSFFKTMQENTRLYYTANIPPILRTHPLDEERIAEAENRIKHHTIPQKSHLEYDLFKARIWGFVSQNQQERMSYFQDCKHMNPVACQYGQALSLIQSNQPEKASTLLTSLVAQYPNQLDFKIALANALLENHDAQQALSKLQTLKETHPDNYAVITTYASALLQANQAPKALNLLLKSKRKFKNDQPLCELLARVYNQMGRKGYAYLTQAQCLRLQGLNREAYRQLKIANTINKNDRLLSLRINALMDEIKREEKE